MRRPECPARATPLAWHCLSTVGEDWRRMADAFASLPRDPYYVEGLRFRTLNRLSATRTAADVSIRPEPSRPFLQRPEDNPELGGLARTYASAPVVTPGSRVVREVVAHCIAHITPGREPITVRFNLHLVRYQPLPERPCHASPRKLHRDGNRAIGIYLVARSNLHGGATRVANERREETHHFVLDRPGEGFVLDDRSAYHMVETMTAVDPNVPSYRDVLIVDALPGD